jgi:signal transduction histidine kinase
MMQSLRRKLTVSHILPTLLLLPLLSLYLLYSLESFYTQNLLQQLVTQAQLLRNEVEHDPELAANGTTAQTFLNTIAPFTDSRVLLLDKDATVLASTRKEDARRIGSLYQPPAVQQALSGGMTKGVGPGFTADVAYVVLPLREAGQTTGALRLSYEVDDVRAQFDQLRWLIVGGIVLTVGLALGLAWLLSAAIARPLRELTLRAHSIAAGDYRTRVAIRGRDEVGALANSFNQMAERLEHAENMRERQLAAIAHELARPLTGMRAGLETLEEDREIDPEMYETVLGGLGDELDRLERLIGTLRGLHKRALNPLQLHKSPIAPQDIVRACISNFEPAAEHLGVNLLAEIPAALPLVLADEDRLIQVMTNLLDNALKFTPRGGRITVQAGTDGNTVWIRVADTGVGIAPEELPNLFQQFYRGAESRPPEKRGMGLGLAICREIIAAHGGRIGVESEPGCGAQFTFTLPRA